MLETAADLHESATTSIDGFHRRRVIDAIFIRSNANNRPYPSLSAGRAGVLGGFMVHTISFMKLDVCLRKGPTPHLLEEPQPSVPR